MDFEYEVEKDGEVVEVLNVEADFAPVIRGRYEGRPEHCYPDEGGEFEGMTVYLGDTKLNEARVDELFGTGTWSDIKDAACEKRRFR